MREWHQAGSTSLDLTGLYPLCLAHSGKLNMGSNKALIPFPYLFNLTLTQNRRVMSSKTCCFDVEVKQRTWSLKVYQLVPNRFRNHMEEDKLGLKIPSLH